MPTAKYVQSGLIPWADGQEITISLENGSTVHPRSLVDAIEFVVEDAPPFDGWNGDGLYDDRSVPKEEVSASIEELVNAVRIVRTLRPNGRCATTGAVELPSAEKCIQLVDHLTAAFEAEGIYDLEDVNEDTLDCCVALVADEACLNLLALLLKLAADAAQESHAELNDKGLYQRLGAKVLENPSTEQQKLAICQVVCSNFFPQMTPDGLTEWRSARDAEDRNWTKWDGSSAYLDRGNPQHQPSCDRGEATRSWHAASYILNHGDEVANNEGMSYASTFAWNSALNQFTDGQRILEWIASLKSAKPLQTITHQAINVLSSSLSEIAEMVLDDKENTTHAGPRSFLTLFCPLLVVRLDWVKSKARELHSSRSIGPGALALFVTTFEDDLPNCNPQQLAGALIPYIKQAQEHGNRKGFTFGPPKHKVTGYLEVGWAVKEMHWDTKPSAVIRKKKKKQKVLQTSRTWVKEGAEPVHCGRLTKQLANSSYKDREKLIQDIAAAFKVKGNDIATIENLLMICS
jgi:hypothetical protein